jgi:hypothetical protein
VIIYKIQNKINGKIYIGQTKYSINHRIKDHLKSNSVIGKALRKYELQCFDISVIDSANNQETLCNKEMEYINLYNSKNPNGYNLTDGGRGMIGLAEESKEKMKGPRKPFTEEHKKNMRKPKPPRTKEHCDNLSKAKKGKIRGPNSEESKNHIRKPMSPEGKSNIAIANRNPDKIKRAAEKMMGDNNHMRKPEYREMTRTRNLNQTEEQKQKRRHPKIPESKPNYIAANRNPENIKKQNESRAKTRKRKKLEGLL